MMDGSDFIEDETANYSINAFVHDVQTLTYDPSADTEYQGTYGPYTQATLRQATLWGTAHPLVPGTQLASHARSSNETNDHRA